MPQLTSQEIRELAQLARLSLSDERADEMRGEFESILGYLATLQTLDVDHVAEYLSAPQPESSLRPDSPQPIYSSAEALSAVPEHRDGQVMVPKFKED